MNEEKASGLCDSCGVSNAVIVGNGMHLCTECNNSITHQIELIRDLYRSNNQRWGNMNGTIDGHQYWGRRRYQ